MNRLTSVANEIEPSSRRSRVTGLSAVAGVGTASGGAAGDGAAAALMLGRQCQWCRTRPVADTFH